MSLDGRVEGVAMSVGGVCIREVVVAGRKDSVAELARLMRRHHVGDVVVVEEVAGLPRPVGIVTDRDLVVEVLARGVAPDSLTAEDVMSFRLLTARESDGLWETLQRMKAKGVRRVPVVDEGGALVGILSADDLLDLLAEELSDLVQVIRREIARERESRR